MHRPNSWPDSPDPFPDLRLDTRSRRGGDVHPRGPGGVRGGMPSRGFVFSRKTSTQPIAIPCQHNKVLTRHQ